MSPFQFKTLVGCAVFAVVAFAPPVWLTWWDNRRMPSVSAGDSTVEEVLQYWTSSGWGHKTAEWEQKKDVLTGKARVLKSYTTREKTKGMKEREWFVELELNNDTNLPIVVNKAALCGTWRGFQVFEITILEPLHAPVTIGPKSTRFIRATPSFLPVTAIFDNIDVYVSMN